MVNPLFGNIHAVWVIRNGFIRNENGTSPIFENLKNGLALFSQTTSPFLRPKKHKNTSQNCIMYYIFIIYFGIF